MTWVWLGLFVLFLVLELEGNFLIFIWGAVGALAAFVIALLGGHLYLQIFVALFTAIGALILLRKKSEELFKRKNTDDMYLDRLKNSKVIVQEEVTDISGQAQIDGKIWTARTDGEKIPVGANAMFVELEGNTVKLWLVEGANLEKQYEAVDGECQKE